MAQKQYQINSRCPVCGGKMHLTRLECDNCQSALEGHFTLGPFQNLTAEQLQFLEVFIRCRGQNKAIQEMLDISYPTVIKKLDELIVALGYEPDPVEERRREVLEMLSQNKITAAQAQNLLLNATAPASANAGGAGKPGNSGSNPENQAANGRSDQKKGE